jgi:glycosyltransferase involved in cell wall biosynthesis
MSNFILLIEGNKKLRYGYGDYIRGLVEMLGSLSRCKRIIVVKTDCFEIDVPTEKTLKKLTLLKLPRLGQFPITSERNQMQYMISKRVTFYVLPYLDSSQKNVLWVNSVNFLNVCGDLRELSSNILIYYTHHSFSWKYFHRYNDDYFEELWKFDEAKINPIAYELTRNQLELAKMSSMVFTVTEHANSHFRRLDDRIRQITTIYNWTKLNSVFPRKSFARNRYKFSKSDFILLFVGRLCDDKGVSELIESVTILSQIIPNFKLVLAGGGINEKYIRLSRQCWRNIVFLGEIGKNELTYVYKLADIGTIPSFHEQCSIVSIEMRMAKLPIIAANVDGLREMFTDGEDSSLFDVEVDRYRKNIISPKSIAEKVYELYCNYPLRKRIGHASYVKGKSLFKKEKIYSHYSNVLLSHL